MHRTVRFAARPRVGFTTVLAIVLSSYAVVPPAPLAAQPTAPETRGLPTPDATLRALDFITGRWGVPSGDPLLEQHPEAADLVILEVRWVVGGKAMRWREHVPLARPEDAELEGIVYWDPAQELIRFTMVAGRGEGQGRLFVGTLTPLADGGVEKVYDVFYRTAADTPGEELGGARRRYREVLKPDGPDGLTHTLDWWRAGRWEPFGRGRYALERIRGR